MQIRYFDECSWQDVGDGLIYHFVDEEGEQLAEVGLKDGDSQLWKFQLMLPERYQFEGINPAGYVFTQASARKIVEMILCSTIIKR